MAHMISKESLVHLKSLTDFCKSNPAILHDPQFRFLKEFVKSFGGKITHSPRPMPITKKTPDKAEGEESDHDSVLEFDMGGCIDPDELSVLQVMGDESKQPTDDDIDKANDIRRMAMFAFSEGKYQKSVDLFTEAILVNPQSAMLYTKRGQSYLKLNKPNACIKDCTHALGLNCDSAPAYKFRGGAHRLLGNWEQAAKDLRQASKIDLDEQTDEWLKEVHANVLKVEHHRLKQERKSSDSDEMEKMEKIWEAEIKTAPSESRLELSEYYELVRDPDMISAFQDPVVAAAFQDPANLMKYHSDPEVQALIEKFAKGGMGLSGFGGVQGASEVGSRSGAGGFGDAPPKQDGLD